jgi:hypothetical protein
MKLKALRIGAKRWLLARRWRVFIAMGLSFFVFGACSLNLFYLFKANASLLLEHGWMALADGGARQLLELLFTGYVSMAAYLVFKVCEYSLVHWLIDDETAADMPREATKEEDK